MNKFGKLRGGFCRYFHNNNNNNTLLSTKVPLGCSKLFPKSSKNTQISRITMGFSSQKQQQQQQNDVEWNSKAKLITDYTYFLNEIGLKKRPSLIRELTKLMTEAEPGTIFLAGGLPNPTLFPFQSMSVQLDSNTNTTLSLDENQFRSALQYQPTLGYPPLLEELKKMTQHFHNPPNWSNSDIIMTVGSQHALNTILEMVVEKGDPVVVPCPVYSSCMNIMDPLSPTYLAVPEDHLGMQPIHLKSVLANWYSNKNTDSQWKKPKIMYVNPTGSNPSGVVIPTERKREIYKIAREYDLLILEDDPYYFLHFEKENPRSFLSLDVDGRVLRLDSFSKILSSGLRVGFVTASKPLVRYLELCLQTNVLHAASLPQVLVDGILKEWGIAGFLNHIVRVKELYRRRRDLMVAAAEKHLKGLATWHVPQGGMFLWLNIVGVKDTYSMVMEHGLKNKIMFLPGKEFMPIRDQPCSFLRASYSVLPEDQIQEAMARLAKLIREEQKRQ